MRLLEPYDALLVAGAPAFTYHAEGFGPHWPEAARLGLLSEDPRLLAMLPGGMGVLGDVAAGLGALAGTVRRRKAALPCPRAAPSEPGMSAPFVLSRIAALRPADAVLVEEAPTARGPMHDHLPIICEKGFFTTASGGLGYALPASVGVARALPARKVIALVGDGSAMYVPQALWSAARATANVSFLILNNGRYAALESFAPHFGMNTIPGTELGGIDFVQLAQSMGVAGRRVDGLEGLDSALEWSLSASGPTLVELAIA